MSADVRNARRWPMFIGAGLGLALPAIALAAVGSWSTTGPYGGSAFTILDYEAGPSTLYAAGNGGVFRSLSSGTSWQRIQVGLPEPAYAQSIVTATSSPVLYLTNFVQLFRSGNGGDLWVPVSSPVPTGGAIYQISLQRGTTNTLAITTSEGVYVSTTGGTAWTGPGTSAGATGSAGYDNEILYAADGSLYLGIRYPDPGYFGGAVLLKSVDGGSTWTPLAAPALSRVAFLIESPLDPQRIHASDGAVWLTSGDGGTSWTQVATPESGDGCGMITALAASPASATSAFVGCYSNGVHVAADVTVAAPAWTSWTAANGLTANTTDPVQASGIAVHPGYPATPTVWTSARDAGLFRTTNNGALWSAINQGFESAHIRALAAHPLDTNPSGQVILAGNGDSFTTSRAIVKSSDGGASWTPALSGLNAEQIRAITIDPTTVDNDAFTAENFTVYAVGRSERLPTTANKDGGIYKSTDAGDSWTTIDNGIALVGGVRDMGTVRSVTLDPRSCAAPPTTGPCPIGSGPLQKVLVAGGGHPDLSAPGQPYLSARIYRSSDAGATWSASESGLPLPQDLGPIGANNYAYMGGIVPLVIDPSDTQTMYAGSFLIWSPDVVGAAEPSIANGVFKSTDGGLTWVHSSSGLPHVASPTSSNQDVLALAIDPANTQVIYAGVINLFSPTIVGRVYKTTDGGANWFESSTGIAGQDVRALFIDPADTSGNTVYAGTGGDGANPGGVYVTTNGGATWNSLSIGMPAYSSTSLAMPARTTGAAARILAGTNAGVWDYTAAPDPDSDGSPSAVENSVMGGDGNGDGIPDATQTSVASLSAAASASATSGANPQGASAGVTIAIVPADGGCARLNDSVSLASSLYPPDPLGATGSHDAWGLVGFSLPDCSGARVRVTFHGATFGPGWTWRNYGPRTPGDATTFGWYTFSGAQRVGADTWELAVDALRQGNYRDDADNILFIGGPAETPDVIFGNGFE